MVGPGYSLVGGDALPNGADGQIPVGRSPCRWGTWILRVEGFAACQFANDYLPLDAKVLLAIWETRGYYLDRTVIWANPISQRIIKWEQFDDVGTLAAFLRSLGITHILWNTKLLLEDIPQERQVKELLGQLLAECGHPIHDRGGVAIYELEVTECTKWQPHSRPNRPDRSNQDLPRLGGIAASGSRVRSQARRAADAAGCTLPGV
jgi:hypothetical protein